MEPSNIRFIILHSEIVPVYLLSTITDYDGDIATVIDCNLYNECDRTDEVDLYTIKVAVRNLYIDIDEILSCIKKKALIRLAQSTLLKNKEEAV